MHVPKSAVNTESRGGLGVSLLQYRVNLSSPNTIVVTGRLAKVCAGSSKGGLDVGTYGGMMCTQSYRR